MEPAGVVGIFTPWNSSAGSIASVITSKAANGYHFKTGQQGGACDRCRMHGSHQAKRDERYANGSVDGRLS